MFIEERHEQILKIINEKGRISIGEIQETFDVSVDSARRDLRILEEKGLLKRTHGGAIPVLQVGQQKPSKCNNANLENVYENYDAIAKKAVEFIKPNDSVYITAGNLGYLMLKYFPKNIEFTVITNSVDNASFLRDYENISVFVVGGKMRANGRIVDSFAQEFVRNMRFDLSFLTGAGFSAEYGASNGTPETSSFQRAIANNSRKNIALFPSQKIGHNAFLKDVDANKFDLLITDWDAVEDELAKIEDLGIEVIVVQKE
ncbi:DeoR/GlpR transcriptional regulator [Clostridium sp. YIM B02515]|uniref:DeoR/GlpR transcriptional regulator n=1 Tax=Clostridium rhizosphaerae TaxID=2803861 RepID=A0ABS1TIH5_9CLOT|nr:DeoR/GlpR family DNA-binding transcription regulator [Clostridium rhizosphaerae]MBL4938587.1 DeoR/GlpR transcriptional regulator [Clostridium rhizosphaerae]